MVRAPSYPWSTPAAAGLIAWGVLSCGCIQHRTAVNPPLASPPPAAGEPAAITQLVTGATIVTEPQRAIISASPLPIDLPVSVWRRDSDGSLSRGEMRVTTALPWWQRFPADVITDLTPIDAEIFASGTAVLTPVPTTDRSHLFDQAVRDGYAHSTAAAGRLTP